MDFLDKLGKNVSNTCKTTAEKTSKLAKETKLKFKISDCKSKISDIYEKIGEKVYQKHIREEDINIKKDLAEDCAEIDFLSSEIADARQEILNLRDKKQCKNCFYEMEINFTFCPECGEKQEESKSREEIILEDLENSEVPEHKQQEAKDVKENLQESDNKKE